MTLQHQGSLADDRNQFDRATNLYAQALRSFQEAGNLGAMMRTYNLLGAVEHNAGRLAVARAWYERSRELAQQLQDQPSLAAAAHNIGVVCQHEGEVACKQGDMPTAQQHFEYARRFVEESLSVNRLRSM